MDDYHKMCKEILKKNRVCCAYESDEYGTSQEEKRKEKM